MRVAFISTIVWYPWGGADTLWTGAAEAAQARGDKLLIAVSDAVARHPRISALVRGGARLVLQPPPVPTLGQRVRRKARGWLNLRDPLLAALQQFKPDVAVFSGGGTYDLILNPAWPAWLHASGIAYRIVANFQVEHPALSEDDRARARDILTQADRVFFVSQRNLDTTRRHLLAPLENARVIQNPLRWKPADRSPWPAGPGWRLATVSRLEHEKGLHLLLQAAAEVLGRERDWSLSIFGTGPTEPYLREIATHLGLTGRVGFPGYVPDLGAIWRENQLMVSPAINDGVPMTIPEAMLCERPVLATAVGGAEEWISPGETGFIAPGTSVPLLAAALRSAWEARTRWEAMGRAAAVRAAAYYRPGEQRLLIEPPHTH